MILYKLEWPASSLYVGAENIGDAIEAAHSRGYTAEPLRVLTCDNDLVVAAPTPKGKP